MLSAETVRIISQQREKLHHDDASSRPLSKDYEYIGLLGEVRFSELYNLSIDLTSKHKGDNGIDFYTPIGTIDVKTAQKPYHLLVEKGKVFADIYVLAQFSMPDIINFIGWHYGEYISQQPTKYFGYNILNHYIHQSALYSMFVLPL